MAQEYPTSPNPWIESASKYGAPPSSTLEKILSSERAKHLLTPDFSQQIEDSFKQSYTHKFVTTCEKIDQLQNELFTLKLKYHRLQAQEDLSKLFTKEKLDNHVNSLAAVIKLFSGIIKQKDVIMSILSIDTDDCDLCLPPSIHEPLQGLLNDIQKSVSVVNSLENDISQLKELSSEGKILTNLKEIRAYIEECVDTYRDTYTKIKNLPHLF